MRAGRTERSWSALHLGHEPSNLTSKAIDLGIPILVNISAFPATKQFIFLVAPNGWYGDWYPTPHRQFFSLLAGEIEVRVSDGEVRRFKPGGALPVEDTIEKGHVTQVEEDATMAAAVCGNFSIISLPPEPANPT